jgi:hypothetical protein
MLSTLELSRFRLVMIFIHSQSGPCKYDNFMAQRHAEHNDLDAEPRFLTKFAWLSIGAAIADHRAQGRRLPPDRLVGLLSDAIESLVNLAGAVMALIMLVIAARPADERSRLRAQQGGILRKCHGGHPHLRRGDRNHRYSRSKVDRTKGTGAAGRRSGSLRCRVGHQLHRCAHPPGAGRKDAPSRSKRTRIT